MKIQLVTKPLSEIKSDYLVLPVFQDKHNAYGIEIVQQFLKENPEFGKLFESQDIYSKGSKIFLLGTGKLDKFNFINLQNWISAVVKNLSAKAKQISIVLPVQIDGLTAEEIGQAVAIGAEMMSYDPTKDYKSEKKPIKLTNLEVVVEKAERGYQDGLKKGLIIADSINLARRLGDMPSNQMTPAYFLATARKVAKENRIKITVLDEKQAKRKGMGAFIGVAQGSDEPSYMIALEYTGDIKSKEKWGLVGKGITFDSGGTSIKSADSMLDMKYDMMGAAAVLGTMQAVAKLGIKTNVVGVMAVTENMPGGKAQKPGDIVKTYSGKTAEIWNTDAEGRLVLIDGLTFAQKDFKATKLIDLATLTGAIIVSLGDFISGAFSNNPKFANDLITVGSKVGEKYWEMPMYEEFDEMVKGKLGDIHNIGHGGSIGSRTAGSITAAKFLEAVVENNRPWIHLDIAGTAWDLKPKPYREAGATGVGIKTLVKLIENK